MPEERHGDPEHHDGGGGEAPHLRPGGGLPAVRAQVSSARTRASSAPTAWADGVLVMRAGRVVASHTQAVAS